MLIDGKSISFPSTGAYRSETLISGLRSRKSSKTETTQDCKGSLTHPEANAYSEALWPRLRSLPGPAG